MPPLTHAERDELQIERMEDAKLMHHKLDTVLELAGKSDRALQGQNGDTGLVADMAIIKPLVVSMNLVLNGDPDDRKDVGMASEHLTLMEERKDKKDDTKWLIRLVVGFILLELLAGAVVLVSL